MSCGSAGLKVASWLEATPCFFPFHRIHREKQAVLEDLIYKDVKKLNTSGAFLKESDKQTVENG